MKLIVSGSQGLVGSALLPLLAGQNHTVQRLTRSNEPAGQGIFWNPLVQGPDPAAMEGADTVIHLAGESIASRWTVAKKREIRDSRVEGTRLLVSSLLKMKAPPKTFLCAAAIGYYGNHGDDIVSEESAAGQGFLADVCRDWESATAPAAQSGMRVVNLRFGVILSAKGGALAKMLTPFKLGLGGKIASGRQFMSWIALDDVAAIISFALTQDRLRGPVNVVAPNPATNDEFTKTLGRVLRRPTLFPMPAFAARLAFGEMADALLIGGARVKPAKLLESGYAFRYPTLEGALRQAVS